MENMFKLSQLHKLFHFKFFSRSMTTTVCQQRQSLHLIKFDEFVGYSFVILHNYHWQHEMIGGDTPSDTL